MTALIWTLATFGGLIIGGFLWAALTYREPIKSDEDPIERQFPEPRPFPNQRKDKRS